MQLLINILIYEMSELQELNRIKTGELSAEWLSKMERKRTTTTNYKGANIAQMWSVRARSRVNARVAGNIGSLHTQHIHVA